MFTFHEKEDKAGTGMVLSLTIAGAIQSDYHAKLNMKHCTFASDIVWAEETLCATVHIMSISLAQFLIKHREMFNVSHVIVVTSPDSGVPEVSLLDGQHMDPLEFLALLSGEETQSSDGGGTGDGDDNLTED